MLVSHWAPLFFLFLAVLGLIFGSFASVLIARVPEKKSLWTRSECPQCHVRIHALQNIPLLSYLLLRGRCKNCSNSISVIYPAIEISMALLFIIPGIIFTKWEPAIIWIVFSICALPLTFIDVKLHRLPDALTASLFTSGVLAIAGISIFGHNHTRIIPALIGAFALSGFYLAVGIISRGGMGMGDVKLAGTIGLLSGYFGLQAVLVSSFAAFLIGALVGIVMMIIGSAGRKTAIPFGPFMILGQYISLLAIAFKFL